jgi:hypothetical protein
VYIDGSHSYDFVKHDIEHYYPLVKARGIVGGHDYYLVDVSRAVNEFVQKHGYRQNADFFISFPDWWIIKR